MLQLVASINIYCQRLTPCQLNAEVFVLTVENKSFNVSNRNDKQVSDYQVSGSATNFAR